MKSTSLPKSLHRYFWDVDAPQLNLQRHPQYVIQRLLEMGDAHAVRWVRRNFSEEQIKETVKKRRGLSPKTAGFWASFLKIPSKEVVCLQKPYLVQHRIHWPY
ncbi:MAG: DUF6922 domain-containing protein [Patescibacteria group bacterium]